MSEENTHFAQSKPIPTNASVDIRVVSAGVLLFFGTLIVGYVVVWLGADEGAWPTLDELPVSWTANSVTTLLLVLASGALVLATRASREGRWQAVRSWLIGVVLLGSMGMGIRIHDYGRMAASIAVPWKLHSMLFDHPNLYYLQAVRYRLAQHSDLLESRRLDHPDQFDDADAQNLDLVQQLQTGMATWTERQVAQWLVKTNQRRQLMQLLAYQIYPLARLSSEAEDTAIHENQTLVRNRRWLLLLRNYCQVKSKQFRDNGASDKPNESANDAETAGESSETSKAMIQQELARLSKALAATQAGLDTESRRTIASVMSRTNDKRSAQNQVTELDSRLGQIDQRLAFVRRFIDPKQAALSGRGLNALYRWLQLPVYIPGGKAWFAAYDLLFGLHCLLVLALLLAVGAVCFRSVDRLRNVGLASLGLLWHTLVLVNVVITSVLFFL